MGNDEIAERLKMILRRELAECEQAIRARDPVRALNDLADASNALKSLIRSVETATTDAGANIVADPSPSLAKPDE